MSKFLENKEATEALFAATRILESDAYKTEVIKEGLQRGPVSLETTKILLEHKDGPDVQRLRSYQLLKPQHGIAPHLIGSKNR